MKLTISKCLPAVIAVFVLVSGCNRPEMSPQTTNGVRVWPGMNEQGEVTDPKKIEAGSGQKVKGINDYEGEIVGKPVEGSKFDQLKIGMSMRQAVDIVGQPTDQGAYASGKAWIPFYFGGDRTRFEMTYKGKGRLIFAGGALFDYSGGGLIWIINSANETGYR